MKTQEPIWEEKNTPEAKKALEQVGISTGRRERKKLSSKGIAITFRRGNNIVELQNGTETVIKKNLKSLYRINGVAKCIKKDWE